MAQIHTEFTLEWNSTESQEEMTAELWHWTLPGGHRGSEGRDSSSPVVALNKCPLLSR